MKNENISSAMRWMTNKIYMSHSQIMIVSPIESYLAYALI